MEHHDDRAILHEPPRVSGDRVFSVSKKGELTVLQPEPSEKLRTQDLFAVRYCLTHVLSIEED